MNIKYYFFPQKIWRGKSKYNQNIEVIEFLGRRSLRVNNMTQSGSIVEDIYKKIIPLLSCHSRALPAGRQESGNLYNFIDSRVKPENDKECKVLILGFGVGTFAKLIKQKYPPAKIIGVEIDKVIIELGKKYFETDKINNLKIINSDAIDWVTRYFGGRRRLQNDEESKIFDIIFVDLYRGEKVEPKIENGAFLSELVRLVSQKGVIIFNRLNFSGHKKETEEFKEKLQQIFSQVTFIKSYSNIIFLCKT
ncbi:MAG: hypothetical protein M1120_01545 [Patescibacteria group bacterium]|nr:hypothetical protein [Patescibacteria group bacterium]